MNATTGRLPQLSAILPPLCADSVSHAESEWHKPMAA